MKKQALFLTLLLGLAFSLLTWACGNSNSPSAPSKPTHTPTWTATSSNTPTQTLTATSTGTPTKTDTVTPTSTSTQTLTITDTPTITLTPTITPTPTSTNTPTITFTMTSTFTQTTTDTPIVCPSGGSFSLPSNSHIGVLTSSQTIAQRVYISGNVRVLTLTTAFTGQGTIIKNLGIYSDDGSGTLPNVLLGSGQFLDTSSSGIASVSLNLGSGVVVTAGYYWLAISSNDSNNCNVYGTSASSPAALLTGQLPDPANSTYAAPTIDFAQLGYTWVCP